MKQTSPASLRNNDPILAVLRATLPAEGGLLLGIASGTGTNVAHFAAGLPAWTFQPSDPDPFARGSIAAWRRDVGLPNLREPLAIDVTSDSWPIDRADAMTCINMIHISPWEATQGLLRGAARVLAPGGLLLTYGPYRVDGRHTSDSNDRFDRSLRARDPRWGVRDLEAVRDEAAARGLELEARHAMPANNFTLVFRRSG